MAKRAAARLTVSELIAEASDFSRDAWRACWLPILLVAAGHALQFLHGNMAPADWRPGPIGFLAYLLMIFYVPLYGGLYRIAIGGRPAQGRGFGGLQWNGVEWRLIAVGVVVAFLVGLSIVPFLALMGVLTLVFGTHRVMSFGPLGSFSYIAVASVPVWLLFFWLMAPRIARLMLGWAYSTAREKTEPFAGWEPARRSGWPIAWVLALAWAPMLLGYLVVYALTLIEGDALQPNAWPLPEALGAGILLGVLRAAVVAPLLVGAITGAFWLLEESEDAAAAETDPVHPPPMVHGEAYPPGDAFPNDEAAAAAAALSAQQAAELDLPPSEVDHGLTESPAEHAAEPSVPAPEPAQAPRELSDLQALEPDHALVDHGQADAAAEAVDHPAAEHPAPEHEAPEHQAPEHQAPEHQAPEPAPDHHAGLAHALEAAAAAAAIAAAAAVAAHEAHKAQEAHEHEAHEAEAHPVEAAHEPEPEPQPTPEPEAVHDPEPAHAAEPEPAVAEEAPAHPAAREEMEALSPWPHSVLPPWPVRDTLPNAGTASAAAAPATGAGIESYPADGAESFPPLAHRGEPAHRFVEITELP